MSSAVESAVKHVQKKTRNIAVGFSRVTSLADAMKNDS